MTDITKEELAADDGASLVGFIQDMPDAVARTVESKLRETVSIFDFMSQAEIADYEARTAETNFSAALDLTTPIQNAIYASYAAEKNLYCPAGAAKVTGLEAPTETALYNDDADTWKMFGQGSVKTYALNFYRGTAFISNTDSPVFRYRQRRPLPVAGGNWDVSFIRFQQLNQESTAPVILIDCMTEYAAFHHNQIMTYGEGNGIDVSFQVKGEIHHNFVMNRHWLQETSDTSGIGINVPSLHASGCLTLRKNSVRGFDWGYVIGDGVHDASGTLLDQNEASNCKNGFWIKPEITACTINKPYLEGIHQTCVLDEGNMTSVLGGMFYTGFAIGIDSTAGTYGNLYQGNYIETAGAQPCTLIAITSTGAEGGPSKTIQANTLLFSRSGGSVAGVKGIHITGIDPRLDIRGNAFEPRGPWIGGAGTVKIDNAATGRGVYGLTVAVNGQREFPYLSQGAISLGQQAGGLSQNNVTSSALALSPGSLFLVNATVPVNVFSIASGTERGRLVCLRATNGNMVFKNSATLLLAGGADFTGPGTLTLITDHDGTYAYAYEVARTNY